MKKTKSIKQIGIWMDHERAKLLEPGQSSDEMQVVHSSGKGVIRNSERHIHHQEQNETHAYYKHLAEVLVSFGEIFISGPSGAHNEFHNFLNDEKHFAGKKIQAISADYITDNQFAASVSEHFKKKRGTKPVMQ